MAASIPDIIKFKQEINELIDTCLCQLTENKIIEGNHMRLIDVIMTYHNRMSIIYNLHPSSDDESELVSDETGYNSDDYTNIMKDRVWANPSNVRNDLVCQENTSRKKLLDTYFNSEDPFINSEDPFINNVFDDSSVDPINYSSSDLVNDSNEDIDYSDDDNDVENPDHVSNNNRKTMLPFIADSDIEILSSDIIVDYNEPTITN